MWLTIHLHLVICDFLRLSVNGVVKIFETHFLSDFTLIVGENQNTTSISEALKIAAAFRPLRPVHAV